MGNPLQEPVAVKLGKENTKEQLKRSKKFKTEATRAIFSGIEQRKQRDALVSSDRNVLESLVDALANIMASANETGQLEEG